MCFREEIMLPILNQSYWRDEVFSVLLSLKDPLGIIQSTSQDVSPPLYYLILHYWILLFNSQEVSVRTLSLVFHVLTAIVVFFIARSLFRSIAARIFVPLLIFFNPFLLAYAFEARPYSMVAFLTVLAVYLVIKKRLVLSGLVIGLGILTHNFFLFTFCGFMLWWLYINRKKIPLIQGMLFASFPLLSILLWGSVIWTQWAKVAGGFWIKTPTNTIFLHTVEVFSQGSATYLAAPMLYTFSLLLFFFAFSYWMIKDSYEETSVPLLFAFVGVAPIVITYFISVFFAPIYHERYLIGSLPVLLLLASYSLYHLFLERKTVRYLLIIFIAVYSILLWQTAEEITRSTTKPAINYGVKQILLKAQSGDIIIPKDVLNFLETKYYVQQSNRQIPVYAYSADGKIPFYIGSILYDNSEIIQSIPKNKRVWQIEPDGGHTLFSP